jgi:hypothetical protein
VLSKKTIPMNKAYQNIGEHFSLGASIFQEAMLSPVYALFLFNGIAE